MIKPIIVIILLFCATIANAQTSKRIPLKVGELAPELKFQKCLDKDLKPNFYKNKILVIDFWATWCAPCIAGFPHFNELSNKFKSDKVVFASLTDEPVETVEKFFKRTQKKVNALRLIDTSKVTGNTYGILFLPTCMVIDQNNKLRWTGIASELTEAKLQEVIDNPNPVAEAVTQKPVVATATAPTAKPNPKITYFNFSATKAYATDPAGGSARTDAMGDYIELNRGNISLGDLLGEITGYSPLVRFNTNDTAKLNRQIKLSYATPLGKADSLFAVDYAGRYLLGKPRINYLIYLLQNTFRFSLKVAPKKAAAYEMVVTDKKKLESFKSMQTSHSSFDADVFPRFEIVGYTLKSIATELESAFKKAIVCNIDDPEKYDLSLNISDIKTLNQSLAFHGLQLKEVNTDINIVDITFK
jgi:thiol-disulfide isomerase/thioredoxin